MTTTQTRTAPSRRVQPAARQPGPVTRAIRGLRPNEAPTWEIRQAQIAAEEREAMRALRERIAAQPVLPVAPGRASMGTAVAKPRLIAADPNEFQDVYAMIASGTCLEPVYMDGCKLLFDPVAPYRIGDYVVIYRKPEFVRPGDFQAIVKRIVLCVKPPRPGADPRRVSNIAPCLVVEQLNPNRMFTIMWDEILAVHKCMGLVPATMKTRRVSDAEMIRAAASRKAARPLSAEVA